MHDRPETPRDPGSDPASGPPPSPSLAELALDAHRKRVEEAAREQAAADRARRAQAVARQRSPEDLGLERCPDCGWWRDPVPELAWTSASAFRAWQRSARAPCMCTTQRCLQCHEPIHLDRPTPAYYSPERKQIVRSGGFPMAMLHGKRCRAR